MNHVETPWMWRVLLVAGIGVALALGCVTGPDYYGPPPPPPPSTWGPPYAAPYQGHMERALEALQYALSELYSASGNKGGHRGPAINLTRQAIDQVNAGIGYANAAAMGQSPPGSGPPGSGPPGTAPPGATPPPGR